MKCTTNIIRSGFDKKKCLVHARCCAAPHMMLATAQYLDISGSDLFSGIYSSISTDGGKTWSEFREEPGLAPIATGGTTTVPCDMTPMYHKKSGKIIVLGHTAEYLPGKSSPLNTRSYTPYAVWDEKEGKFSEFKFIKMPDRFENCGNGSAQSLELENGELLIPVYYRVGDDICAKVSVMRVAFENDELKLLEIGAPLSFDIPRGIGEPSIVYHDGWYYLTIRNDECGLVTKSRDGLNYEHLHLWSWDDGSILQNYNTQQHWMKVNGELYLVYTRRGANNDHVFRHRAPLFAARVENMQLVRGTEIVVVPERGARLGNFGAVSLDDGRGMVMASEWMQPEGCEAYGSDNALFVSFIEA